MKIDENNNKHLIADEGKVLRRISDNWIAGMEIYLGYAYQIGGKKQELPKDELPEHYEEIDEVLLEEVTDDAFDVPAELAIPAFLQDEAEPVNELETAGRPTLADLLSRALIKIDSLEKEMNDLKKGSHP